jgi:hypothetical protein
VTSTQMQVNMNAKDVSEAAKRRDQEIRFFKQTTMNACFMEVNMRIFIYLFISFQGMIISFHLLSLLVPTPIGEFFTAYLPFYVAHGMNG